MEADFGALVDREFAKLRLIQATMSPRKQADISQMELTPETSTKVRYTGEMKILGRQLSEGYDVFYISIESEIAIDLVYEPLASGFRDELGDSYFGLTRLDFGWPGRGLLKRAHVLLNMELPDDEFSVVAAHELGHVLQHLRGYCRMQFKGWWRGGGSVDAILAQRLQDTIECVAVDRLIAPFGLEQTFMHNAQYESTLEQLANLDAAKIAVFNNPGTPQMRGYPVSVLLILRYIQAGLEQPAKRWVELRRGYRQKLPYVARLGELLLRRVREIGLASIEQRRDAMLAIRDGLNLKGRVFIFNPVTRDSL